MTAPFEAILFDAGGVLLLPDHRVLGPLLEFYGGDASIEAHHRAHYAAMAAKSRANAAEIHWDDYDVAYVSALGVPDHERAEAAYVLGRTRHAWLWRYPVPGAREVLAELVARGMPVGVVSNASGQIEQMLARSTCHVGAGPHVEVRCVVDSEVVGVAKPHPAIFDHALIHLRGIERDRIAFVGDSYAIDVVGARHGGMQPVLIDPYDDYVDLVAGDVDVQRIRSLNDLL